MKNILLKNHFYFKNIPNFLTLGRILLIFPIIYFFEVEKSNLVWYLLLFGGITDYLDGFLARKFKLASKIGSILDPLADKIIIIIPLIWLCNQNIIPFWSISLLTLREFIITAFRSLHNDGMPALKFGKYKTLFLFLSLILILSPFKELNTIYAGIIFYWIGFSLNVISFTSYLLKSDASESGSK